MIIDFRMVPPVREYMDPEEARGVLPGSYLRGYLSTYEDIMAHIQVTVDDLLQGMEKGSVGKAVLQGEWAMGDYRKQNDAVHRIVREYPDKFLAGFLFLNPMQDSKDDVMSDVVEREVKERGFKGVNIQPFACRLRSNDKKFYPVYAKCQELKMP